MVQSERVIGCESLRVGNAALEGFKVSNAPQLLRNQLTSACARARELLARNADADPEKTTSIALLLLSALVIFRASGSTTLRMEESARRLFFLWFLSTRRIRPSNICSNYFCYQQRQKHRQVSEKR